MRQGLTGKNCPRVRALARGFVAIRHALSFQAWNGPLESEYDQYPPRITEYEKNQQVQGQALSFAGLLVAYAPVFHHSLELLMDRFFIKKG